MFSPRLSLLAIATLSFISVGLAEDKQLPRYTDTEAAKHVGEDATVTGMVVAVGKSKQGSVYLNMGQKFPKQTFSGVVHAPEADKVGDMSKFDHQRVTITGKIELYNDKPQIVITAPEQIQLAGGTPAASPAKK